jgi:hypothetical protein
MHSLTDGTAHFLVVIDYRAYLCKGVTILGAAEVNLQQKTFILL